MNKSETGLPLFDMSEAERIGYVEYNGQATRFREEFKAGLEAYSRNRHAKYAVRDRLASVIGDTALELRHAIHLTSAGGAFLKIYGDLVERGANDQQILDFYRSCLRINSAPIDRGDGRTRSHTEALYELAREEALRKQALLKEERTVVMPPWFKGDKRSWLDFMYECSVFGYLIHPDKYQPGKTLYIKFRDAHNVETKSTVVPEWLEFLGDDPIDIDQVRSEYDQDLDQRRRVHGTLDSLQSKKEYLNTQLAENFVKGNQWVQKRKEALVKQPKDLAELLMYLSGTEGLLDVREPIADRRSLSSKELSDLMMDESVSRSFAIQRFVDKHPFSRHLVGLWLERETKRAFPAGIDRPLNADQWDNFQRFLQSLDHTSTTRDDWLGVKKDDSKLFWALENTRPLFGAHTEVERNGLYAWFEWVRPQPIGNVLMAFAAQVEFKASTLETSQDIKKIARDIKRTGVTWIEPNWRRGYEELIRRISTDQTVQYKQSESSATEVEELNKETESLEGGNLSGWSLAYVTRVGVFDEKYYQLLGGGTLAEREAALKDYLAKNKISGKVNPGVLIDKFDRLVGQLDNVERDRIRVVVNGVEVEMEKRSNMVRVFYKVDSDAKTIAFFILRKQNGWYPFDIQFIGKRGS